MAFNEFTTPELIKAAVQMAEAKGAWDLGAGTCVVFRIRVDLSQFRGRPCPETRKSGSLRCSDVYCGPYGTGTAGDGHLSRTSATAGLHGEDGVNLDCLSGGRSILASASAG